MLFTILFLHPRFEFEFQIGQRHGGLMGQFQRVLSKWAGHIWFELSESKDRAQITRRFDSLALATIPFPV